MNTFTKTKIEITCASCGNKLSITFEQVVGQKTVSCTRCNTNIHLKDKSGKTKQLLRKMDNITKRLKNLSGK